ncbi:MAG: hypothetical protein V3U76_20590 [Granulosicoccus sp.]
MATTRVLCQLGGFVVCTLVIGIMPLVAIANNALPAAYLEDVEFVAHSTDVNVFTANLLDAIGEQPIVEGDVEGTISGHFTGTVEEVLTAALISVQSEWTYIDDQLYISPIGYHRLHSVSYSDNMMSMIDSLAEADALSDHESIVISEGLITISAHAAFVRELEHITLPADDEFTVSKKPQAPRSVDDIPGFNTY